MVKALLSGIAKYVVKPGKSLFIHSNPKAASEFSCVLKREAGVISQETRAGLGDASLYVESFLQNQLKEASAEVSLMFGDLKSVKTTMHRSKGALSIEPKLVRGLKDMEKAGKPAVYNSMDDAIKCVGDGIGSRVITDSLETLSKEQINSMIKSLQIEGKPLSAAQKDLLTKYIYQQPIRNGKKDEAFRLFEEFAKPLVEARSKEVVDQLTLGILKRRILEGEISISTLKSKGLFDEALIKRLETEEILPIQITEINNYRGKYGLAEFSNNQIRQIANAANFQKVNGERLKILSDPRGMDRYSKAELAEAKKEFIKASGYRTAQINVVHANGAYGEIQFRGDQTNIIGEYEHLAYELRKGKNTLGPEMDEFAKAITGLSRKQYAKYSNYLEECYNYYNRIELGLPAVKPKLPHGFNKVLSEESLKTLHHQHESLQKYAAQGFYRHISYAA